jgi:hypothetical protein
MQIPIMIAITIAIFISENDGAFSPACADIWFRTYIP